MKTRSCMVEQSNAAGLSSNVFTAWVRIPTVVPMYNAPYTQCIPEF